MNSCRLGLKSCQSLIYLSSWETIKQEESRKSTNAFKSKSIWENILTWIWYFKTPRILFIILSKIMKGRRIVR